MRIKRFFILLTTVIVVFPLGGFSKNKQGTAAEQLAKRAAAVHDKVLTVDTHTDTPMRLSRGEYDMGTVHDPQDRGGKIDFPRMKQGGLDAVFFAVYVDQGPRTPEGNEKAKQSALKGIDLVHQTIKKYPQMVESALTTDDAYKIEKKGKRAIYIGIENGYPVGKDISLIKKYYDLGVRYITLCHGSNNDICDSSTDDNGPEHNGLSDFGKQVVQEMNRLGMVIDVSHMSDKSFYDVLEVSKAPVMASHSCARALCDHERNLTDDMLKKLAEKDGVIQVCMVSDFVKKHPDPKRNAAFKALWEKRRSFRQLPEKEQQNKREEMMKEWLKLRKKYPGEHATVADLVNHIDHIVKIAGIDHVGIGSDFDGGGGLKDCFDVSEMGNITLELVKRGYTEEQIRKIWGGNFMRIFKKVEKISRK
jgi:membrane dipeptidase